MCMALLYVFFKVVVSHYNFQFRRTVSFEMQKTRYKSQTPMPRAQKQNATEQFLHLTVVNAMLPSYAHIPLIFCG